MLKVCNKCGELKWFWDFSSYKRGRFGLRSYCKRCHISYSTDWRLNNGDRYRAYHRRYRRGKCYGPHKNRDEHQKCYRQSPKGIVTDRKYKVFRRAHIKETDIDTAWLLRLKTRYNRCPICGEWRPDHLDHIIPICVGGPHIRVNIRYLCETCNLTRPRDASDLVNWWM